MARLVVLRKKEKEKKTHAKMRVDYMLKI